MEKLRITEVIIVEGKYDAAALASQVEGLILPTGGFSIYSDEEKKALIRTLGKKRGLLILTDSDRAGFQIRTYVEKIAAGCTIRHAYIPAVPGKEARKAAPGKEGLLGVEGLPPEVLRAALQRAGVVLQAPVEGTPITHTHLYQLGLSGTAGSAARRRALLHRLGLPQRLSKRALCQVVSSLYTLEEFSAIAQEKPVLFWDFHGTITKPDILWFDAAMEAAAEAVPEAPLNAAVLHRQFSHTCLPWFTIPGGDTRHITGAAWWAYCEGQFAAMFQSCGFTAAQAAAIAPRLREKVLQPHRYHLQPDALFTLKELQHRGYESHILSNNFPELAQVVKALGLAPYFGEVLVSGNVGYDKPRGEIFDAARSVAGQARALWMIGDNPVDDVAGGNAAGFVTVAANGAAAPDAAYQIPNLAGLLALLP